MAATTAETTSDGHEYDISPDASDSPNQNSVPTTATALPTLPTTSERNESVTIDHDSIEPRTPLEWKIKGNVYFGKEDWKRAMHAYDCGLTALVERNAAGYQNEENSDDLSPLVGRTSESPVDNTYTADPIEVALRSNLAFVLLKLQKYNRAEDECNKLLLISPSNIKALYRRACAREGLYFSLKHNKEFESEHNSGNEKNVKQSESGVGFLHDAICDLEQAVHYIETERREEEQRHQSSIDSVRGTGQTTSGKTKGKNRGIIKQCRRSLERLQKERNRQQKRHEKEIAKMSLKKMQSQQRQDVVRLLLARHNDGRVIPGEAFFLLEWNWWVRWCRFVDFFDIATAYTKGDADDPVTNPYVPERARCLLNYFPKGAILPLHFREEYGVDDGDYSSDENSYDSSEIAPSPGCIDNSELLVEANDSFFRQWYLPFSSSDEGGNGTDFDENYHSVSLLKPNLIRGYHYEIVPREVYNALRIWYGETTPSLCRRIGSDGNLIIYPNKSSDLMIYCQQSQRCNACRAPGASSRCQRCMMVQYCGKSCQESHWRFHRHHCRPRHTDEFSKGGGSYPIPEIPMLLESNRVGLNNLGNTCFMNSALQSLSHATPLTRYFLSNRFKVDLNKSNPLGTSGKLALAYEEFLKEVWMKQGITSTSPTALKRSIALFAPRFAGYQQHDAQEFLAYLLDGLHEDLNRVRRAPYVEMPDITDGHDMKIAAAESWNAHKRRNDSVVMDTFYGQFKSTCVCPSCNRVSVSFDTFNHVSLEIPSNQTLWTTINIPVLVHFADGNRKPVRYGVKVPKHGFIYDLKNSLSKLTQVVPNKIVLTDVYENSIYKLLDDRQSLSTINTNEDYIVAYEVTPYTVKDTLHMIVSHSLVVKGNSNDEMQKLRGDQENTIGEKSVNTYDDERKPIGLPFITSIDSKDSTCNDLWNLICGFVRRIVQSNSNETALGGTPNDFLNAAKNCELDHILTINIVDSQGQPRCILTKADGKTKTNILPNESRELLSKFLGESCADDFLFLTLVWNFSTDEEKKISVNPDSFVDYDVHQTLVEAMHEERSKSISPTEPGVTLHQCFQSFSRPERLDVDNMWYCSKCKQHVQALKTIKLWRLPNVLVIHLKRFEFRNALRRDKLDTFVDFPLAGLDMNPHCAGLKSTEDDLNQNFGDTDVPADYDLFAVVNHYGRLGFGHYTAYAMQWDETGISKKWNAFDDSTVRPIQPNEIQSSAAYILFYRRRLFH